MTREEQDKRWNDLSDWERQEYRDNYNKAQNVSYNFFALEYISLMNKTYGSHNLQPKLTYEDVARELFKSGYYYYDDVYDEMVCTSSQQVKKIHAIHKLLNVAKYLNKNEDGSDWVPDWENLDEDKYYICFDYEDGSIKVDFMNYCDGHIVYFRTVQIARQTIEILGEEVIRTALGNY